MRDREPLTVRVVYPAPEDVVRVTDSSFLLGSVGSGDVRLTINGTPVKVWPDGGWLAWLPFPPDTVIRFRIEASRQGDSAVLVYPVRRDRRFLPGETRAGRAWIDTMSFLPRGQMWLPATEYVGLSVRAAEASTVRVHLPNGVTVHRRM